MTEAEIYSLLSTEFGDKVVSFQGEEKTPFAVIQHQAIHEIMSFLKRDERLKFDSLMSLSGFDLGGAEQPLGIIYHLYSMSLNHYFAVKVLFEDRENPKLKTINDLFRTADWHEREAYDMYGITFEGHPDFHRILLEDDWEGYPLRKDYVQAEFYRGMKIAKEK
ncbi:MAG TPA: NADH-quinone oxidoreductase subunit C [Candidatus Marinimicrobia bacterium]|nr:MAG: hypothetical protein AUJ47_06345 [Candidatus Marinimicrobia bacterium CG1_02_48_14]HCW77009.1 NADH-quinone oxidoreductase subunit C [Candidatus Neomarinimicrobiota bacterium]